MDTNENEVVEVEEEVEEETPAPTEDPAELKARIQRLEEKAIAQRERTRILRQELAKKTRSDAPKAEQTDPKPADNGLLAKAFLRSAGITQGDEVELALTTAKKWDMQIDQLVDDEDFKIKLDKLRTTKANAEATSNVRGRPSVGSAKETEAYWIAKGVPPSPADVPDRKTRAKIVRAMLTNASSSGKTFYND